MNKRDDFPLFDEAIYSTLLGNLYPRVLTQIDRDPDSPTYGSCDRNFWMYRLHDFDSGVLQQASLGLAAFATLPDDLATAAGINHVARDYCAKLVLAINRRTVRLLEKRGYLDEYFPGEESFPATAFASYGALKSAIMLEQGEIISHPGLRHAAERCLHHAPSAAANQDAAAAAFLFLYSQAHAWKASDTARTVQGLLAEPDGTPRWMEYGGLDIGYASVTLNFLALLAVDGYAAANDHMVKLARLLADFVTPGGSMGGEFASRSTSYFLPYGLVQAARCAPEYAARLGKLDPVAAAAKLDDRYLLHYCLPSFVLAAASVSRGAPTAVASATIAPDAVEIFDHSAHGLIVVQSAQGAVFLALNKGGAFQLEVDGEVFIDCGYRVRRGDEIYASAVIGRVGKFHMRRDAAELVISVAAPFQRYRVLTADPAKTIALRVLRSLGPWLNRAFKRHMINEATTLPKVTLDRVLRFELGTRRLTVEDRIAGLEPADELRRAPASSLRLVPSAKFYQPGEDVAFAAAEAPLGAPSATRIFSF